METQTAVRDLVRQVVEETDCVEWDDITDAVLARIDPRDYADALRQVLRVYVTNIVPQFRKAGPVMPSKPEMTTPITPTDTGTPRRSHVSSKFAAIADDWQKRLREIYPSAEGVNKHLADMTHTDLVAYADRLRRHARATMGRANGFQNLADALQQHKVEIVADLPVSVAKRLVEAA